MIDISKLKIPSSTQFTFTKPQENNIVFYNTLDGSQKEVLRISAKGVTANPDVPVDEAADAVIRALDGYIKNLVKREWVGLTVSEMAEIAQTLKRGNFLVAIQNIEAKLKEKNNA